MNLKEKLRAFEYGLVWNALVTYGSIAGAARHLGCNRTTLQEKIRYLGIDVKNAKNVRETLHAIEKREIEKNSKQEHLEACPRGETAEASHCDRSFGCGSVKGHEEKSA